MTLTCEMVREQLADGAEPGSDRALEAHLSGCAECRALARALCDVDLELEALPLLDPPAALVARTIARIAAEPRADETAHETAREQATHEPTTRETARAGEASPAVELGSGSLFAAAIAVTMAALTAIVTAPLVAVRALSAWLGRLSEAHEARAHEEREARGARRRGPWLEVAIVAGIAGVVGTATWQRFGNMIKGKIDGSTSTLDAMPSAETEGGGHRSRGWFEAEEAEPELRLEAAATATSRTAPPTAHFAPAPAGFDDDGRDVSAGDFQQRALGPMHGTDTTIDGLLDESNLPVQAGQQRLSLTQTLETTDTNEPTDVTGEIAREGQTLRRGALSRGDEGRNGRPADRGLDVDRAWRTESSSASGSIVAGRLASDSVPEANRRASAWAEAHRTEGLRFRARDGWWQSTYVPGDPAIRLVHARLAASQALLPGTSRTGLAIAEEVTPIAPPLDAPQDRALAVGAFADTAAIDGPTRVRVEVALRSVAQAAGRRGPLRVAVVLDADSLDTDAQARTRALVMSLSRASTSRDRVALFASGPRGGELAPLGPMRAGRLEVALRHLFDGPALAEGATDAAFVSMADAVTGALESVSGEDGVGLVLVVTPDDVRDGALEHAIHVGTVAGITTSAIGVGPRASLASLDEIALAGQGRRRIVITDEDALAAVRAELTAAAELVARAVRVRVRLAEGVELVDVLGSRPLDAEESARTREVEQSIDRDLARRLGILSDRDEDESGVRMLIPAFYANDAHAIVLDLLVSRPGPVLDVDVALKDLVRLGNARASASLTLPSGAPSSRGPRELRVVSDLLAHETALALARASDALSHGDVSGARTQIEGASALIESARSEEPRLADVASLTTDAALLASFDAALRAHVPSMHESLRDALSLAASRRLLRPRLASSE